MPRNWTANPYMTSAEMATLRELLAQSMDDSLRAWKLTRLKGISATLSCEGNTSIELARAFDEVRRLVEEHCALVSRCRSVEKSTT